MRTENILIQGLWLGFGWVVSHDVQISSLIRVKLFK